MSIGALRVVVVDTRPLTPQVHAVTLPPGATVREALCAAGVLPQAPAPSGSAAAGSGRLDIGIFGQRCTPETMLRDGDRIEVYRALDLDPKEARRRRAALRAAARTQV
jgi:uncharacterized protein